MKFLGIDYGTKRIGIAISDENSILAFPKEIVSNDANAISKVGEIVEKEKISEFVIGESVNFSGKPNAVSDRIEIFISELQKRFNLPIHKQKEFLTSVEARRGGGGKAESSPSQAHSKVKQTKSERIDASAAALILQRYLDRKNKEKQTQ